jgi:hypothetical protein
VGNAGRNSTSIDVAPLAVKQLFLGAGLSHDNMPGQRFYGWMLQRVRLDVF